MKSEYTTIVEDLGYELPAHPGIPEQDIAAWEARTGETLPGPLREYLLAVGNMPFNRAYNKLYTLDELRIEDGKLIFMVENQNVVHWATDTADTSEDPLVFQQAIDEDDELWYPEEEQCATFLELMIYWQTVNGGFAHFGLGDAAEAVLKKIARDWERKAAGSGVTCYARKGVVVCVVDGETDENVMLAASSEAQLDQAIQDLQALGMGPVNVN